MKLLDKILPEEDIKRKWVSIVITTVISGLLALWCIYENGQYGLALFVLNPFFIGFGSTFLYGYKNKISMKAAILVGLSTLAILILFLLIWSIEGLICIAMVSPLAIVLTLFGSFIGYKVVTKFQRNASSAMVVLIFIIPLTGFIEKNQKPELVSVVTFIDIDASPDIVWENVIEFPELDKPTEFLFKTGIAYPINAKIKGSGVGAIRYCNFTTGSFVEPITVWDQPNLLKFSVLDQPQPMKEISFWDINAPHLQDYFVSKEGQFKLTALPNGKTRLEGTTWYYHDIKPAFYWRIWSNYIIHKIHNRVLTHIKVNSERSS